MSWITGNVLSLFHRIPRMIEEFFCQLCTSLNMLLQQKFFFSVFCSFHSAGPSNDLLRACTGGSKKKPSLDCRLGKYFPAELFNFLQCQVYSVRVCTIMLKNDVSSHWAFATACSKLHWQFIFWSENQPISNPQHPTKLISSCFWPRVWFCPSSYLHDAIPYSVILFQCQNSRTSFHHQSQC